MQTINQKAETEVVTKKLRKTQEDWIAHFNSKGEKMMSAADLYSVAKSEHKTLIQSLSEDLEDYIVTSTRITYSKENLTAEITQDFGSEIVKPKTSKVKVPVFNSNFKEDPETEAYLQELFDTKDKLPKILRVLKGFGKNKIWLWTPSQSSRASNPVRSVQLCFNIGRFVVNGYGWIGDGVGLSRGVIVTSAKQTPKSKGDAK